MPAGRYRMPIVIERSERDTDAAGERVDVWKPWLNRRASVKPMSAREQQTEDVGNTVLITHTVRLRSDALTQLIRNDMRLRIEGRSTPRQILHIESVIDVDNRGVELELRCVERAVPT